MPEQEHLKYHAPHPCRVPIPKQNCVLLSRDNRMSSLQPRNPLYLVQHTDRRPTRSSQARDSEPYCAIIAAAVPRHKPPHRLTRARRIRRGRARMFVAMRYCRLAGKTL